jgi:hypothetical protein
MPLTPWHLPSASCQVHANLIARWWNSGELTGDWGGPRNALYDEGVIIFSNCTNNIAGNPVGGKSAGFTYCDNLAVGLDLDLKFEVNGGLADKGLIPACSDDYTCFGIVYGKFSSNFAGTGPESGGGDPDFELVFEWNSKVQLTNGTHRIPTPWSSELRWASFF